MSYIKTNWVNGSTPINETNLNKIENQLELLSTDQKILWTTEEGAFMFENQTANLSETILQQKNGIVLLWSGYETDHPLNYNCKTTFIPKKALEFNNGELGIFEVFGGTDGIFAYKYIKIYNDIIYGDACNVSTISPYNNMRIVLRRVYGV